MASPAILVRNDQRDWAQGRGLAVDAAGYTATLDDNLFQPIRPETVADFEAGDGGELGEPGRRGKMQALHSSSALACNVFDYWRGRDGAELASALDLGDGIESLGFERKLPTGLTGRAPNLDVVLLSPSGRVTAIECKFLEPYGSHAAFFTARYFEKRPGLWETAGFPRCQALAERLHAGARPYRWLNAPQLLKHILGLHRSAPPGGSLLYLWYQVPGATGDEHAAEAASFAAVALADGIDVRTLSYQRLYRKLEEGASAEHRDYLTYLGERYFAER